MVAEFDWWLLILGLVVGASLVWLILADLPRRDAEMDDPELAVEAGWIAAQLDEGGGRLDTDGVEAVLRAHRAYLRLPPPDELAEPVPESAAPIVTIAPVAAPATPPIGPEKPRESDRRDEADA